MLLVFDALLVVVLALLLYAMSARDAHAPPGAFDVMQVVLLFSALFANAVALSAIAARITEFGFSPNRLAVLGVNVILLVNLRGRRCSTSAVSGDGARLRALNAGRRTTAPCTPRGQIVVIVFPPLFHYA